MSKDGTRNLWYETSKVWTVHKWYETSMVWIVYGTKSPAFHVIEKRSHNRICSVKPRHSGQIVVEWLEIVQLHNGEPIGNQHSSFKWYHCWPPMTSSSTKLGSQMRSHDQLHDTCCHLGNMILQRGIHVLSCCMGVTAYGAECDRPSSVCLSVCLSVCPLSICLWLSDRLSVTLSVMGHITSLYVCVSVYRRTDMMLSLFTGEWVIAANTFREAVRGVHRELVQAIGVSNLLLVDLKDKGVITDAQYRQLLVRKSTRCVI